MRSSAEARTPLRATLKSLLEIFYIAAGCFLTWKAAAAWADTPSPAVIVTTESMVPTFYPGDILFISNHHDNVTVGEMPVIDLPGRSLPMIHRVIEVTHQEHDDPRLQ